MRNLIVLALVGFVAQLVDGALGMAYGVTTTTLLLTAGIAPAMASASVHLGELGTTLVSGISHWRFGNVDWQKIGWMAVPGGVGAFAGAMFLSSIPGDIAEPFVAVFLFGLGVYILARFAFNRAGNLINDRPVPRRFLSPLGLVAGFLDAVGGGGWGPISTPALLSSRRMEPRKVVGTVDASEFVVALCASLGFLFGLSLSQIPFEVVGAILVGGIFAAPIAAWVVRHLNARVMGAAVGGFILLTNARTFLRAVGFDESLNYLVYAVILVVWATALFFAMTTARRERKPIFETT